MTNVLVTGMTTNKGGVESFIFNYVSHLADSIQFDFWCSNTECAYENKLKTLGCTFHHGEAYGNNPVTAHKDMQAFFAKHAREYAVLWSNKSMLVNIDDLRLAKQYGIPRIILHSHNSRDMFSGISGAVKAALHRLHRRPANRLATDYWACSKIAAQYFFTTSNLAGKWYAFIPNAIDAKRFAYNADIRVQKRDELGIADHTVVIGFVGRLEYQKDPELLMRIFIAYHRMNPDSVLLVIGTGELQESCEAIIAQEGISASVRFLGSRGDVPDLYQAMDAFCLPSRFEGLPVVLVEAQAAGLPCIVADSITTEVCITNLLVAVSRTSSPINWTHAIEEAVSKHRDRSISTKVVSSGFDIDNGSFALLGRLNPDGMVA